MVVAHEVELWNRALGRVGERVLALGDKVTVTATTAASPVVCTAAAHGYVTGDYVLLTGLTEAVELNGRVFRITVLTAATFELEGEDGLGYQAETTGGFAQRLPNQKPTRVLYAAWPQSRDAELRSYPWNSVTKHTRLARLDTAVVITGATQASEVEITTSAPHGYVLSDQILIEGVVGMVELNDRFFTITPHATDATKFTIGGEDSTNYVAYSSAGTAKKVLDPLKPDVDFGARYAKPGQCLRVLGLIDSKADWQTIGDEVYTDETPTAPVRYIKRIRDVTQYDAGLVSALAARMQITVVHEITQGTVRDRELAQAEYFSTKAEATQTDSLEQSPADHLEDDWIEARR